MIFHVSTSLVGFGGIISPPCQGFFPKRFPASLNFSPEVFGLDILIIIMRDLDSVTDASDYVSFKRLKKTHIKEMVG